MKCGLADVAADETILRGDVRRLFSDRDMEDYIARIWEHLGDRIDGPMSLRFFMQPTMAIFFGIRDGLRFAREKRSFLLWGGPKDPAERHAQFVATWRSIGKVFLFAILLDTIYQAFMLHWFYLLEALIVAVVVAVIPYLIVRFLVNYGTRARRRVEPPDQNS